MGIVACALHDSTLGPETGRLWPPGQLKLQSDAGPT